MFESIYILSTMSAAFAIALISDPKTKPIFDDARKWKEGMLYGICAWLAILYMPMSLIIAMLFFGKGGL